MPISEKTATHRAKHLAEGIFELKAYPGAGFCLVKNCRKRSVEGKLGLCHCHHQTRFRRKDKKRSAYTTLRDHAKARGLEFSIDFSYLEGLMDCAAAWDIEAEKRGDTISLDRIDESVGYRKGNIQVITLSANVAKNNRIRRLPAYVQSIIARKRAKIQTKLESYEEWQERMDAPF